jgi:magnesium-protoporphyrin IX monomethyl ester (oxidative) cyclase
MYAKGERCFITFPLGIAYLAAELVKKHSVDILDCMIEDPKPKPISNGRCLVGLNWEKIKERLKDISPDIVGISCAYSSQYHNAVKFAELVKKCDKKAITVLGGAHPSALPEDTLKNPYIDFIVVGESEDSFVKLVDALKEGKDVKLIAGIGYKNNDKIIINKKMGYKKNIDELPFPARHLFLMEKYFRYGKEHAFYSKNHPSTTLITSRGCPGKCVYCSIHSVFGSVWRARSPSNVEKELEYLKERYHIKEVHFEDDNLTLDKDRMMLICDKMIRNNLKLSWTTPNGVSIKHLDEELIKKMKEAGCYRMFIGVESGNQRVLNEVIKKNLLLTKVEEIIRLLKKYKLKITGFFVIGFPGESKECIEDTIKFVTKHDFDAISLSIASPYPGTELYNICEKNNLITDHDLSKCNPYHAMISTQDFNCKEIAKLRNKACFKFQLSRLSKHPLRFFMEKQSYTTFLRYLSFFIKSS